MFEQTFKNIDDTLWKDAGCGSELDYVEQTSWVLFLKYLDDLEKDKATAAELTGKAYTNIISPEFQWTKWAAPKLENGKIDHNALNGDDLVDFVNGKLFPYLKKIKTDAEHADTIEYKIGEIFTELKNRVQSGYNLREVVNNIDELRFRTHKEKHEMSHLYEAKIKNMGNAGRKANFIHKMAIALKEANETEYWLMLLKDSEYISEKNYNSIYPDSVELIKLLASIVKSTKKRIGK